MNENLTNLIDLSFMQNLPNKLNLHCTKKRIPKEPIKSYIKDTSPIPNKYGTFNFNEASITSINFFMNTESKLDIYTKVLERVKTTKNSYSVDIKNNRLSTQSNYQDSIFSMFKSEKLNERKSDKINTSITSNDENILMNDNLDSNQITHTNINNSNRTNTNSNTNSNTNTLNLRRSMLDSLEKEGINNKKKYKKQTSLHSYFSS